MAYDNNQMGFTRRSALVSVFALPLATAAAQQDPESRKLPVPEDPKDDQRLPNGKSRNNAIAQKQHEEALKEAEALMAAAKDLKESLEHDGTYVVDLSTLKKTEEIEKLARRIRSRLKN